MTPLLTSRQDVEQNKNKLKIGCVARSLVGGEVQFGSKSRSSICFHFSTFSTWGALEKLLWCVLLLIILWIFFQSSSAQEQPGFLIPRWARCTFSQHPTLLL